MCHLCEQLERKQEREKASKVNLHFTESQTLITEAKALATLVSTMVQLQNIGQKARANAVGKMIDGLLPKVDELQEKPAKAPDARTKQEEIANLAESLAEQLGCTVEVLTFPQK